MSADILSDDACGCEYPGLSLVGGTCSVCWRKMVASVDALRAAGDAMAEALKECVRAFEQTHINYCGEAWTSRGLHASECLEYEVEDASAPLSAWEAEKKGTP